MRIILEHRCESLRFTCGQCGDTKDLIFSVDPDNPSNLDIDIVDSRDVTSADEEHPEFLIQPKHIVI